MFSQLDVEATFTCEPILSVSESPREKTVFPSPSPDSRSSNGLGASPLTARTGTFFEFDEVKTFGEVESKKTQKIGDVSVLLDIQ